MEQAKPEQATPATLFGDFTRMMEQFKLPGIDVAALMEARRKDIEALAAANRTALEGMQSLGQKQAEILRTTMGELQSLMKQATSPGGAISAQTGEAVQQALRKDVPLSESEMLRDRRERMICVRSGHGDEHRSSPTPLPKHERRREAIMEATSLQCSRRHASVPLIVAVGHTSMLVSNGLAEILARVPGCHVQLWRMSPPGGASRHPPPAQLVFGDLASLSCLRREASASTSARALTDAKFVLVTACDEAAADLCDELAEVDECVSVECREDEVFTIVQRLTGFGHCQNNVVSLEPRSRANANGGLAPGVFRRVREYIEQHLDEKMLTNTLAKVAGLSVGHFNRAFRQSTGSSPHRYILRRRIAVARELLEHEPTLFRHRARCGLLRSESLQPNLRCADRRDAECLSPQAVLIE